MRTIKINKHKLSEKPMRNILGMNNLPKINDKGVFDLISERYTKLNLNHIRFHDAPLDNPGFNLVDISRIFPLFHVDESDEQNYCFEQTDDYMRFIENSSAEVDFRLGETIDHSGYYRLVKAPEDPDKWARVCRNIIGHYKNGEMHGMHLNITRVSVWEEPDNPKLFGGTTEEYVDLFCKTYKLLKRDFPDLKVGGPCSAGKPEFVDKFITLCKEQGVTPDFTSNTMYPRSTHFALKTLDRYNEVRKKHGLENTEHVLTEWHYGPTSWSRCLYDEHGFYTTEAAAFSADLLIALMDTDYLSVAYYYSWATGLWSPYATDVGGFPLFPSYYALLFFQMLATECERLEVKADVPSGVHALAGRTSDGKHRVLLSCHVCEDEIFRIEGTEASEATLKCINMDFNEEDCTVGKTVYAKDGAFEIAHTSQHAVYLLEF